MLPAPRIWNHWRMAAACGGILVYFFSLSYHGLFTYFTGDDLMNLVALHGYWRWPWWRSAVEALLVVTPAYRPMGDVFYRLLYGVFGFHPLPFRVACYALLLLNIGLFCRLAFSLSRSREVALLGTLVFSFHAAFSDLFLSSGAIYDILCVCFTLAALIRYVRVRASGKDLRAQDIVTLLLAYGAALDSKEMAVSLPLALVLYEILFGRPFQRARFGRRTLPVLLAGALTTGFLLVKVPVLADNPLYRPLHAPAFLLSNAGRYLSLLVFQQQSVGPLWLLVLAALASALCVAQRRFVALFGFWYGLIALLPVLTVPARGGTVLYLPLIGFALFVGDLLGAARQAMEHLLPSRVVSFWVRFSPAALFLALGAGLFAVHSHHWIARTLTTERPDSVMRETIGLLKARHSRLPPGTRLLFMDDPLERNQSTLQFLVQAAYHDPTLWVDRQKNADTVIGPAESAVFDYLVWIRDGVLTERRLPPLRWEGVPVPVSFQPDTVAAGQPIQMRVGEYSDGTVDIAFETTYRFEKIRGIALRWTSLDANGVATVRISRTVDPGTVRITAVRVGADVWRKAQGQFMVR